MRVAIAILLTSILAAGTWAQAPAPLARQVSVSVKIIEFSASKGLETGFSAYFKRRANTSPFGFVSPGGGAVSAGDVTFPTSTSAGITVFLNKIADGYGDFEAVLQALVDQNRAFILSRPKAMVPVGADPATNAPYPPTKIETVQNIPYEKTVVIGATSVQTTDFRPTGVSLNVQCPQVVDDDGNINTGDDTYVQLALTAGVNEEGQRIIVALDDLLAANNNLFATTSNAISVPEFVNRSINTTVWVKNGEVLILGGLYRNSESRTLSTLPALPKVENFVNNALERLVPFNIPDAPLSSTIGNNKSDNERRELVFLIKTDVWKPVDTVAADLGFGEAEPEKPKRSPADVIGGVLESITGVSTGFESRSDNAVDKDNTVRLRSDAREGRKAKKAAAQKEKEAAKAKEKAAEPDKKKKPAKKGAAKEEMPKSDAVGKPAPEMKEAAPVAPVPAPPAAPAAPAPAAPAPAPAPAAPDATTTPAPAPAPGAAK